MISASSSTFFTLVHFWVYRTLYNDKVLPTAVRMKLVNLLTSLQAADKEGVWSGLSQRKRKRTQSQESQVVSAKEALVMMVNDSDHGVRMHVAKAITSLFMTTTKATRTANRFSTAPDTVALLNCSAQGETFKQVFEVLQLANVISDGLDELSFEDESVNRVASMIYSLLLQGCVSPTCERMVVKELLISVGQGHIDTDLVAKVGGKVVSKPQCAWTCFCLQCIDH